MKFQNDNSEAKLSGRDDKHFSKDIFHNAPKVIKRAVKRNEFRMGNQVLNLAQIKCVPSIRLASLSSQIYFRPSCETF